MQNSSDNNNLDMADQFAKVRPLFNLINQWWLLNYSLLSTSVLTSQWCHIIADMVLSNILMKKQ